MPCNGGGPSYDGDDAYEHELKELFSEYKEDLEAAQASVKALKKLQAKCTKLTQG